SYTIDLPGINDLVIHRSSAGGGSTTSRRVAATGKLGATYMKLRTFVQSGLHFVQRANAGQNWAGIGGGTFIEGIIAAHERVLTTFGTVSHVIGPGSFNNKYAAFQFKDSTAAGAVRYGWVQLSATVSSSQDPHVTIIDWAYDSSGAQIA